MTLRALKFVAQEFSQTCRSWPRNFRAPPIVAQEFLDQEVQRDFTSVNVLCLNLVSCGHSGRCGRHFAACFQDRIGRLFASVPALDTASWKATTPRKQHREASLGHPSRHPSFLYALRSQGGRCNRALLLATCCKDDIKSAPVSLMSASHKTLGGPQEHVIYEGSHAHPILTALTSVKCGGEARITILVAR